MNSWPHHKRSFYAPQVFSIVRGKLSPPYQSPSLQNPFFFVWLPKWAVVLEKYWVICDFYWVYLFCDISDLAIYFRRIREFLIFGYLLKSWEFPDFWAFSVLLNLFGIFRVFGSLWIFKTNSLILGISKNHRNGTPKIVSNYSNLPFPGLAIQSVLALWSIKSSVGKIACPVFSLDASTHFYQFVASQNCLCRFDFVRPFQGFSYFLEALSSS